MSKLPKAPLLEVIYELRWNMSSRDDFKNYQYLHGDLYAELKHDYPSREILFEPDVPVELYNGAPMYRYRKDEEGYPLCQIGPGVLTFNTDDDEYYWDDYYSGAKKITDSFRKIYPTSGEKLFKPSLIYVDFFAIDSSKETPLNFINNYLNIKVTKDFSIEGETQSNITLNMVSVIPIGILRIAITNGRNEKKGDGLILQTEIKGPDFELDSENIIKWLSEAHDFCSDLFKKITSGALYESFN